MFDSHNISVEQIAKFTNCLPPEEVAAAKDKVDYFIWHYQFYNFRFSQLIGIVNRSKFSIWILEKSQRVTLQKPIDWFNLITFFTGPDPPKLREWAFVAYYSDKLYYLGGEDTITYKDTNRVDVRRSNESPWNNLFRFS